MPLTDDVLEKILKADGWPLERLDNATWRSGFAVGDQHFRFFLRLTPSWVFLTIVPFATLPAAEAAQLPLFRRLLELNREVTLAKFGIERTDVVLTVELPLENLVESQLKDGLDALSLYAGTHHAEIQRLAQPAG